MFMTITIVVSQQKHQLKHQLTSQALSRPIIQVRYLYNCQLNFPLMNPQECHHYNHQRSHQV